MATPGLGRFCQRGAPARRPQAKQSESWTLCPDVPGEEVAGQTAPSRQPRAKSFGEARTRGTGLCSGKARSVLGRWQHRGARRRPEATAVPAQVPRAWPASLHGPPTPHRGGWLCQNMQVAFNGAPSVCIACDPRQSMGQKPSEAPRVPRGKPARIPWTLGRAQHSPQGRDGPGVDW